MSEVFEEKYPPAGQAGLRKLRILVAPLDLYPTLPGVAPPAEPWILGPRPGMTSECGTTAATMSCSGLSRASIVQHT